jgi:hypothetical protein
VVSLARWVLSQATPSVTPDIETEVEALTKNLAKVLNFKGLVEYQTYYLDEVVRRAVNRIPPCSSNGEEFRDALVWLTALDVAEAEDDKTVVLISADGAFHNGQDLRDELVNECKSRSLEIKFFKDLSFFAKDHEDHLGFITSEWINQNIPKGSIGSLVEGEIEKIAQAKLLRFLDEDSRLNQEVEPTGYTNVFSEDVWLDDFFVNRLSDGSIRIEAAYSGEYEVECEVSLRMHYREGRFARPGTQSWEGTRTSGTYTFQIDVYIAAEIVVADGSVTDIKIIDVG